MSEGPSALQAQASSWHRAVGNVDVVPAPESPWSRLCLCEAFLGCGPGRPRLSHPRPARLLPRSRVGRRPGPRSTSLCSSLLLRSRAGLLLCPALKTCGLGLPLSGEACGRQVVWEAPEPHASVPVWPVGGSGTVAPSDTVGMAHRPAGRSGRRRQRCVRGTVAGLLRTAGPLCDVRLRSAQT